MRFPNAVISEALNVDQGNVSNMLNGKKTISDNFFTRFLEKFPSVGINENRADSNDLNQPLVSTGKITLEDYINELREDKKRMEKTIDINLNVIAQLLNSIARHDQAYHETILRSLERIEGSNTDLVLQAHKRDAELQIQDSLKGSPAQVGR